MDGGQVILPATAGERKEIQPSVTLTAKIDGGETSVKTKKLPRFTLT